MPAKPAPEQLDNRAAAAAADTAAAAPLRVVSPQGRLLAAVVLVFGIVLGAPHQLLIVAALVALVLLVAYIVQVSIRRILLRSLVVLPISGMISLFWPLRLVQQWNLDGLASAYAQGWSQMLTLIITPWLCVLVMMLLIATCHQADLLYAVKRLHLPHVLVLLLSFMYRYADTLRAQLRASHRALAARAPKMGTRRQVLLYGNLAGSMLVRAYDRGERIHAAMLARGFNGILTHKREERIGTPDIALILGAALLSVALYLV
ncbi:MAG: energy-coupling factor transporter transmembrane protein EcfT [Actinomycetia bacterium]|nr:energy-coupling factor transporter transmembrane protein EcfT [Actinomycetes bacterium]